MTGYCDVCALVVRIYDIHVGAATRRERHLSLNLVVFLQAVLDALAADSAHSLDYYEEVLDTHTTKCEGFG